MTIKKIEIFSKKKKKMKEKKVDCKFSWLPGRNKLLSTVKSRSAWTPTNSDSDSEKQND